MQASRLLRPNFLASAMVVLVLAGVNTPSHAQMILKTERFNTDPNWDGHNNRATSPPPRQITQNFGFSSSTSNAGGPAGEVGGLITPAGEPAYYAKSIPIVSFNDPLSASGTLSVRDQGHTLLGFFNSSTINEWRTPNSIVLRLYGRETHFEAFVEYGTAKWRAEARQFPVNPSPGPAFHNWSLNYDPAANGGGGSISATIGTQTIVRNLESGHKIDGATFNRFGLLNVVKSADGAGQVWLDNVSVNGGATEQFATDPGWTGLDNRRTYTSTNVRPRFNFGYSPTGNAGGQAAGEIGGATFRGDSRAAQTMAYYGDRILETLTTSNRLHASGKVSFHRGVSDSTTYIGFFHSTDSIRVSTSQVSHIPENFIGAAIEGPSAEGFFFYPVYGVDQEGVSAFGRETDPPFLTPRIYPDRTSHNWSLDYDPAGNGGNGLITLSLGAQAVSLPLSASHRQIGAHFDRFGMITTHVDGNGQTVWFDDLTYTIAVPEPSALLMMLMTPCWALGRRRSTEKR